MSLGNVTLAELTKLRTLRGVPATIAATIVCGAGLAALFVAEALRRPGAPRTGPDMGLESIPYCQVGLIVLGIATTASEYSGPQIRTSLVSVPNRMTLLTGKLIAYLIVATGTALAAVGASVIAAEPAFGALWTAHNVGMMLGATGYLVVIGLLANAVAVLVRGFVTTLVGVLTIVLVLSPVLASVTRLAAYLPDRAGALLYRSDPGETLSSAQGAVVLSVWILALLGAAAATFNARDA